MADKSMANKKLLIILPVAVGLAFVIGRPSVDYSQGNLLLSEPTQQDHLEQNYSEQSHSEQSHSEKSIAQVFSSGDMDSYRQMTVGSRLALQLGADNSSAVAEVMVTEVRREANAVSLKGLAFTSTLLQDTLLQDAEGSLLRDAEGSLLGDAGGSLLREAEGSLLGEAESSLSANGSMVMTIGEKFMHIFLSLDSGIYEYSGKDFQGIVSRTTDMRFKNDTAVLPNQSYELTDQPTRQLAVPEVKTQ